jgi:Tol biopolymer transport system component
MNYYRKILLYISLIFSVAFILYSCKSSLIGPQEGPADERVLFIKIANTITEICSIKPDGTDLRIIASHNTAGEFIREGYGNVEWSPDKSMIVVEGGPRNDPEILPLWLMDNQGNLLYRLTWNGHSPNWSSDGTEILFVRNRDYFSLLTDYYIVKINNLKERLVFKSDSLLWTGPDWSANGEYALATERYIWYDEEGKWNQDDAEVVLIQLSNKKKLSFTDNDLNDFEPQWSPDESRIAYISGRYTWGYQIKLMNSDGSSKTVLIDTLAGYNTLRWSPDGDKIAFNKWAKLEGDYKYAKGSDIFVLDINSGAINQLTNFESDSIFVTVHDWK